MWYSCQQFQYHLGNLLEMQMNQVFQVGLQWAFTRLPWMTLTGVLSDTDYGIHHTMGLNILKALKNSKRFGLIRSNRRKWVNTSKDNTTLQNNSVHY